MVLDEFPSMDVLGPRSIGGTPVTIHVFVEDVPADELERRMAELAEG